MFLIAYHGGVATVPVRHSEEGMACAVEAKRLHTNMAKDIHTKFFTTRHISCNHTFHVLSHSFNGGCT